MKRLMLLAAIAFCMTPAWGLNLEEREFISPIVGRKFKAEVYRHRQGGQVNFDGANADMGIDSDGCKHTSGPNEYSYMVVTCPFTYFSTLATDYDDRGRFMGTLPKGFKEWITGKDGFHSVHAIDFEQNYKKWQNIHAQKGVPMPSRRDWAIPQGDIPLEKRYKFALTSYYQRKYPSGFLGKVALMGAFALRSQMNSQLADPRLDAAAVEVKTLTDQHVQDGEEFDLDKWAGIYGTIFETSRLTPEAYWQVGSTYIGMLLRQGDNLKVEQVLKAMTERFKDLDDGAFLRILVRGRRNTIQTYYLPFLEQAAFHLRSGLANEEYPRPKMPDVMIGVAESLRRISDFQGSLNWYLALSLMPETQPAVRRELKAKGKRPSIEAPHFVILGSRADEMIDALTADNGLDRVIRADGDEATVLTAIGEGLGRPDYVNPNWRAITGATQGQSEWVISNVGKAVLEYHFKMGIWPDTLGDMWLDGFVPNRNQLNRFHCPVSGEPYAYLRPLKEPTPAGTVLVATRKAMDVAGKPQFAAYLANNRIVYGDQPFLPGDVVSQ